MKKELLRKVKDFMESDDDKAFLVAEAPKKQKIEDINAPSRWNMRIWDDDNKEWLCQSDGDNLTYYGFDITGGEVTEFQGLPKWHPNRHLIWEQSTGLKDKNGKEIYEGDILMTCVGWVKVYFDEEHYMYRVQMKHGNTMPLVNTKSRRHFSYEVIGNIHEKPELLGGEK